LANHKSAIKKARSSIRKATVNSKTLTSVRTVEKKVRKALAAKNKTDSQTALKEFASTIDKAAQKGRLSPKTASRKISRLSKQINALA
jgi:small subunit ribosomal protein S20